LGEGVDAPISAYRRSRIALRRLTYESQGQIQEFFERAIFGTAYDPDPQIRSHMRAILLGSVGDK